MSNKKPLPEIWASWIECTIGGGIDDDTFHCTYAIAPTTKAGPSRESYESRIIEANRTINESQPIATIQLDRDIAMNVAHRYVGDEPVTKLFINVNAKTEKYIACDVKDRKHLVCRSRAI